MSKTKKELTVKRVSYGKDTTPVESREYRAENGGPVGTPDEWIKWGNENGYTKVIFHELDSKIWNQHLFGWDKTA